ncbi:SNF2 family N-terminal domain-containing protein [Amylocarpus encephaloides]|uniref:SNF2 family N-terminal domain-containing protein n=1 Tax=Amylocarpus encephaloides TaxID=45428 RepID=A0A9P7YFV2_9HELO|nr:SNF2 family N-terminal domain-containing protein [Amylocarpus encephaloides]
MASVPKEIDRRTIKAQKNQLQEAARAFGGRKIRAVNGKWLLKGMEHALYHHQLLAAAWMLGRETGGVKPFGGLLADSMGLGKTIEMLACMVANQYVEGNHSQSCKATLIVLPSAVIDQWENEIKEHAGKTFKHVIRYRKVAKYQEFQLESVDIVLASYTDIMKQFAYPPEAEKGIVKQMGYNAWFESSGCIQGILHKIDWYRIVLDEAHLIKNVESRTSTACQNLRSVLRWCLTGTPLQNGIEEVYPYLKFMRANYTMDFPTFQKKVCNIDKPECRDRIRALLSICMMRRTMGDTILGRPIVNLPDPSTNLRKIDFSQEESVIYRITEDRFRGIMNTFHAKGDKIRTYGMFMVQLLRLRQCTGHPYMLERVIKECWTQEDVAKAREKLTALGTTASEKFCARTKIWVEEAQAQGAGNNALGGFGKGLMGHSFSMEMAFETLDIFCIVCSDMATEPLRSGCGHIFCKSCHDDLCLTQLEAATPKGKGKGKKDRGPIKKSTIPKNSKGLDFNNYEPFTPYSTWITASDDNPEFPITSSAKITALKAELLQAFEKDPLEKVVVFVQFKLLARIIGRLCNEEGWPFLYFTSDIDLEQRSRSVEIFKSDPSVRILLSGLKCGGVGLNLTCASRCISMDLWWNHSIEMQAFSRIFRIGQKKRANFTRIVVKGSVDDRMLSLQAHKLREIDPVLNGHSGESKLSLKELAFLFGFLKTPEDEDLDAIEGDYNRGEQLASLEGK